MNTNLPLMLVSGGFLLAQDGATPAPAPEPAAPAQARTEMQKWIATTDAQWQATYNREVVDVHAAELKKLAAQYGVSIESAIDMASGAGDLDGAVTLRNEQKRFADANTFPEQGEAASHRHSHPAREAIGGSRGTQRHFPGCQHRDLSLPRFLLPHPPQTLLPRLLNPSLFRGPFQLRQLIKC